MFQPIVLILFASGFTVAQKKELLCRSDDLEISFSTCGDHSTGPFTFGAEPCSFKGNSRWKGSLFWIPKADINVLTGCVRLWHANSKVLEWKGALCKGVDDDYSFCGALKGETINTTVNISSGKIFYPKGEYTAVFRGYAGYPKEELVFCMNYTLIIKSH